MKMPTSHDILKSDIRVYFEKNVNVNSKILDIGAGVGTYSKLLRGLGYKMDCIEVWLPYVVEYKLNELYDNVIIGDVMNYDISNYDVIIIGDVLEHLSVADALSLMDRIENNNQMCLVAVPYKMEQDEYEGNKYEIHKQSDLTNEIMLSRYNNLRLLFKSDCYQYGYYINRSEYYNNDMQCFVNKRDMVSNRLQIIKIDNGYIEYMNDGVDILNVRIDVYDKMNIIYSTYVSMVGGINYFTKVNYMGGRLKYVFSGEGIKKVYEY